MAAPGEWRGQETHGEATGAWQRVRAETGPPGDPRGCEEGESQTHGADSSRDHYGSCRWCRASHTPTPRRGQAKRHPPPTEEIAASAESACMRSTPERTRAGPNPPAARTHWQGQPFSGGHRQRGPPSQGPPEADCKRTPGTPRRSSTRRTQPASGPPTHRALKATRAPPDVGTDSDRTAPHPHANTRRTGDKSPNPASHRWCRAHRPESSDRRTTEPRCGEEGARTPSAHGAGDASGKSEGRRTAAPATRAPAQGRQPSHRQSLPAQAARRGKMPARTPARTAGTPPATGPEAPPPRVLIATARAEHRPAHTPRVAQAPPPVTATTATETTTRQATPPDGPQRKPIR